jgi:subtilisin family serine protease
VAISAGPGWYLTNNGTSFAAPYVTGTVALMVAANPCISNEEIESALRETAVNIDALNPSYAGQLGAGRLNAGLAVERAYNLGHVEIQAAVDTLGCTRNSARIDILNSENNPNVNYVYQWSNGETTSSIINLEDGIYTVIVTAGCASDTATFEINTTLTQATAQLNNSSTPNTANGSINISVSGDGPFTYLWSNGSTSEDLIGVTSGSYSVDITNANGCSRTFQFTLGYTAIKSKFRY